jgi:hypothetical protein
LEYEQTPLAGSQTPAVWQGPGAAQATGPPATQAPLWHVSLCVHAFPSSHADPSDLFEYEQTPVAGSHEPAFWHWEGAAHTVGLPPVQTPLWQTSACVQALPSLHATADKSLHVPSTSPPAATEHASQGPALHAALQQTPSTQLPLPQSAAPRQEVPLTAADP